MFFLSNPSLVIAKPIERFDIFHSGWCKSGELSLLTSKEIDAYIGGGKKKGELLKGYQIAQDPTSWITEKEDEQATQAQYEAERDEDDQLASDDEGAATKGAKGKKEATKKRKRESTAANGKKEAKEKKPKKDATKTKVSSTRQSF